MRNLVKYFKLRFLPVTSTNCTKLGFYAQSWYIHKAPYFHKNLFDSKQFIELLLNRNNTVDIEIYDVDMTKSMPFTARVHYTGSIRNMWKLDCTIEKLLLNLKK